MNELDFKDYSGLAPSNDYDHDKAELLAEAVTEKLILEKRLAYLNELVEENQELTPFLWTTLQGECKPLHKITDSHLKNIMTHLLKGGRSISKTIQAEARSRNIQIPDWTEFASQRLLGASEGEIIEPDDFLED